MQNEYADRSGVCENDNPTTPVFLDYLVKLSGRAIQRLPVTFSTFQYVLEISMEEGLARACDYFESALGVKR